MNERIKKLPAIMSFILIAALSGAVAEELTITQIDTSRLLAFQSVRLYLDLELPPGDAGVVGENIAVSESGDGKEYADVDIRKVSRTANGEEGISFFLLLDNSGSMWDGLDGKPAADPENMRITHAKKAIKDFIAELSVMDRAGLAVFNTRYTGLRTISADSSGIPASLDSIQKPARDEAYTELYSSIEESLVTFGESGRRKVLIVLSDGENFPIDAATSVARPEDGIEAANREGITCYVVNFGTAGDSEIPRIAEESGGSVFDARDSDELSRIYSDIRSAVLEEYAVTYTAAMFPGDKRFVKVRYPGKNGAGEAVRYYYSGTVLGSNTARPSWIYLFMFIVPLLVWLGFLVFKLERETSEAGIRLLYGATAAGTKVFTLTDAKTIIGGDATADITIVGNPSLKPNAATIVFDSVASRYTVSAASDLTVNNKPVKTKLLEPGDVINMSGTVVVFDDKAIKKGK